jgi:hypothetical protein
LPGRPQASNGATTAAVGAAVALGVATAAVAAGEALGVALVLGVAVAV